MNEAVDTTRMVLTSVFCQDINLMALGESHPIIAGHVFAYGTAGFRMDAGLLDSILFSVGLLAVLRSKSHEGKAIGAMITASHNPEHDNGVKLVEPLGEMLDREWEEYAILLANAKTPVEIRAALDSIIASENIDMTAPALVVVGRDTRPSGVMLSQALRDGVTALDGVLVDYGVLTTPQLHYITRCLNTADTQQAYGIPTVEGYYAKLASAFKLLVVYNGLT